MPSESSVGVGGAAVGGQTTVGNMERRVEMVMGLPISLAVRCSPSERGRVDRAWAECVASLRWADLVFSTYKPDSVISRLGRGEITLSDCPAEVAEVFALGEAAAADTGGAFTIHPGGSLDPSGVVKGWAADRASRHLAALGDLDWCLSAGGDLVCAAPSGVPWTIGIEDPHDALRLVARWQLVSGALATSGTAHRGAHVVDGRTGQAAEVLASVSIVADCLTRADIDATGALALGVDALPWLADRQARRLIHGFVVVDRAGAVHTQVPHVPDGAQTDRVMPN
ncbi:MAG: FAD:protein FMN transferase [Nocardioides sp.]